ncbi:VOC family protein [Vogesella sp. XCS3]|uniref:VOC family protein n=1 Tax=Vogesella sp. XCS3 TaxID=2877939 RepID=UPI001D0A2FDA|nr:VOC family protein [Vogesella sp. XCS3]UDM15982.1 VOC family protein [Vogesella sp. XCS3]
MSTLLSRVALVVRDYDEAIAWFTGKLGFSLLEDTPQGDKRWVVVAPPGGSCALLLARAANPVQAGFIGHQAGGRVWLFLESDDFHADYQRMLAAGVRFCESPRHEDYGWVVVFEDLYGNRWDLQQRHAPAAGA